MNITCLTRVTLAHGIHGGMEHHLDLLSTGLAQKGHRLQIVTTGLPGTAQPTENVEAITTHHLDTPPTRYSIAWHHELRKYMSQATVEIDLLWGQGAAAEPIARMPRRQRPPIVSILHGTFLGELRTRLRHIQRARDVALSGLMAWRFLTWRSHLTRADYIIVLNPSDQRIAQKISKGLIPVDVIPNGINTDHFSPSSTSRAEVRARIGLPEEAVVLLAVGRVEREKGFNLAVEALSRLQSERIHLLIVGKGTQIHNLRRQAIASRVENRVHFLGFVDHENLPAYYHAADIFVAPTLAEEGLPLTLLEAMACGLPVVASSAGGIAYVVEDGVDGLLAPISDAPAFFTRVQQLSSSPDLARRLGDAARIKTTNQYNVDVMIRRTERIFERVAYAHR